MNRADYRRLHDDENAEFSAYLHTLSPEQWNAPSLCEGWRVRDVVGHILDGNELRLWTLPLRLARYRFSSDRSGHAYSVARAEGSSSAELLHDFDARDPWAGTCRVFPPGVVLLDRLVHHQDIRRALGTRRQIPGERLVAVLDQATTSGPMLRGRRRARGLRLVATDVTWQAGTGPEVTGPGEALVMALLGRRQAMGELDGDGASILAHRQGRTLTG